jgi:hypothetical protein
MSRVRDIASILTASSDMATDVEVTSAISSHAASADPHTGYLLESLFDAKGDIISASADNTPAKLTVGSNNAILGADSAAATGLSWQGKRISYNPTWTSSGTAPSIGDGSVFGDYVRVGDFIFFRFQLDIGSTTTTGTGTWYFSLPINPNSSTAGVVGYVTALDRGVAWYPVNNYINMIQDGYLDKFAIYNNSGTAWGSTVPFTWNNTDSLWGWGAYRV